MFGSEQGTGSSGTVWGVEAVKSDSEKESDAGGGASNQGVRQMKTRVAVVIAQSRRESTAGQFPSEGPSLPAKVGIRHLLMTALGPGSPSKWQLQVPAPG